MGIMMKKIRLFVLFFFLLVDFSQSAEELPKNESLFSRTELESTIVFLEDSQRVKELSSRLRMILDAQNNLSLDTFSVKNKPYLNFIQVTNIVKDRTLQIIGGFMKEAEFFMAQISVIKSGLFNDKNKYQLYSFSIVVLISVLIGAFLGLFIRRIGFLLKKITTIKNEILNKSLALFSIFLIKSSFSLALIGTGLVLAFIPTGFDLKKMILEIIPALLIYIGATGGLFTLYNPESDKYRIMYVNNKTCNLIIKNLLSLFRFSLVVFILYSILKVFFPFFASFCIGLFMIVMIFWVPSLLDKYRNALLNWFLLITEKKQLLPRAVKAIVKSFIVRMHSLAMIFLIVVTLFWFSGMKETYTHILWASLRTIGVAIVSLIFIGIWVSLVNYLKKSVDDLSSDFDNLKTTYEKNKVILRRGGLICILLISLSLIFESWGISLKWAFFSENTIIKTGLHVFLILLISFALIQIVKVAVEKFKKQATTRMIDSERNSSIEIEKRVATLGNIIQRMAIGIILLFAVIMSMDQMGFDIKAMLAGVGIVGLAVGFGAQSLVKDIISGLFLIFENRIRVGDVAIVNGIGGSVEQVNLRTTVLRSVDGTLHVFPNGSINSLSNMTHQFSYYVFDIGVSYDQDLDKVISVLKELGEEIINDPQFANVIMEPLEISGVDRFSDSSIIIKARIKTIPVKQWFVGREMNLRIKKRFDKEGIAMPFPQRSVHLESSKKPIPLKLETSGFDRDLIKEIIRDVMNEDYSEGKQV